MQTSADSDWRSRLDRRSPNYDRFPTIPVPAPHDRGCVFGWAAVARALRERVADRPHALIAIECYPGVDVAAIRDALTRELQPALCVNSEDAFKSTAEIDALVAPFLGGDDPIFGRLAHGLELQAFLAPDLAASLTQHLTTASGLRLVIGPGASLLAPAAEILVYADMPRWEAQLRQRRGEAANLGAENRGSAPSLLYKRAFFVDWRVADRLKRRTLARWDFLLDTTVPATPKLVSGSAHLAALAAAVRRPFRLVPFFDPGPWGGQWMRSVCDLPDGPPNYAWCFDCVPEENSLLLAFADGVRVEIPALNLVFRHPRELLGEANHARFGAEFPIRFDLLDTMGGGNLSLQVHPDAEYAREHFGLPYTQDESYYLLDAAAGARVVLGRKDGARPEAMFAALRSAQQNGTAFKAEDFVGTFPAKPHDHFLIPAGTLHCSGAGCLVLEISATPYIFTFKLWDWGRLGLDGKPRPINLARGEEVIRWERDESYARQHLVNAIVPAASGPGWREEHTGLHHTEFIETRRHWFTAPVKHDTGGAELGGVHMLNLVAGEAAVVESPQGAFEPFTVHYAETFVVPAAVGPYRIRPIDPTPGTEHATLRAAVRGAGA